MMAPGILGLLVALLYDLILFFLGNILQKPRQVRLYLGLNRSFENEEEFSRTIFWISKIGTLLKIIAVIEAITSVVTTASILSNL